MSAESNNLSDKSADLKKAAGLLLKGGSLISDPCIECGGVQVRFKENIICVNCRNKQNISTDSNSNTVNRKQPALAPNSQPVQIEIGSARFIIQNKILLLAYEIRDETDLAIQKQKAELMDIYLRILQKLDLIVSNQ